VAGDVAALQPHTGLVRGRRDGDRPRLGVHTLSQLTDARAQVGKPGDFPLVGPTTVAQALAIAGGLALGILAAVYQNRAWDYVSVTIATAGVAVPNFVLAVFFIILFSFMVPLFPTGGWDSPSTWVLPTVTLALGPMGIIARFTRASMLEVIRADYTLTILG